MTHKIVNPYKETILGKDPSLISNENNYNTPSNTSVLSNISVPSNTSKLNKHKNTNLIPKTYKLPEELIEKIERIAYWRRRKIQEEVKNALEAYVSSAKPDEIKPIPKEN